MRAAIYYHYGKHLFADRADEWRVAHEAMMRCYAPAAPGLDPPMEYVKFPYKGVSMAVGCASRAKSQTPAGRGDPARPRRLQGGVARLGQAFIDRGIAALTLDGPGQGETSFHLPTTHEWGPVLGAVIDVLEKRNDVDGSRVGVVGQSLGALYAPLAAAGEPRLKACIANCGPFDWGTTLPKMPAVSQEVFRVRSHAKTIPRRRDRQEADARTRGEEHQVSAAGGVRRRRPAGRAV